jgi:hypothetical protein
MRGHILVELQNIERHENSLNSFRVTTSRQTDMVKLEGAFAQLFDISALTMGVSLGEHMQHDN